MFVELLDVVFNRKVAPIFYLDEGTFIKIFSYLSLKDLMRASQVCRFWYRLSFDLLLWKNTDLRRFCNSLNDSTKFQALANTRLGNKINYIDLSGFVLSEESLRVLATRCKKLRVLKMRSAIFTQNYHRTSDKDYVLFPKHLECLDIRFSHGSPSVYRAIGKELKHVKWLGLCDAFFQTLIADDSLETTIDSMEHLRKLDLSHCLTLKDTVLALFARCRNLEVLSVRRCSFLTGAFIDNFLGSCKVLKTLILDGISLDDETMQRVTWRSASLKHLELGWCRFITQTGLQSAVTQIAKIQSLEYLGLCAIGEERALTDHILLKLGVSLSRWRSRTLKSLNVSRSRALTQDGVAEFRRSCSFVEMLDTTDCPAVRKSTKKDQRKLDGFEKDQVYEKSPSTNITISECYNKIYRRRNGSISATQFARSKYVLETPL